MQIPRIVHQLWKTEHVPKRWRQAVESVRRYHKGWEYRLWTDALIDDYVRTKHARFYPVFAGMNRHIMRIDVFRYLLMHDVGGLYCDLDCEFVRPYDYGDAQLVLSLEYDVAYGDPENQVANYVFASAPGHALWRDVLDDLQQPLRGRAAHAEAGVQPAAHPRPSRAEVLRQQRHHARLPLRLGLVAGSAELRLSKGEDCEAPRCPQGAQRARVLTLAARGFAQADR